MTTINYEDKARELHTLKELVRRASVRITSLDDALQKEYEAAQGELKRELDTIETKVSREEYD